MDKFPPSSDPTHSTAELVHGYAAADAEATVAPLDLRRCCACKFEFPRDNFSIKDASKGTLSSKCKPCVRAYSKQNYLGNRAGYVSRVAAQNEVYRERNRAIRDQALVGQRCCCCPAKVDLTFFADKDVGKVYGAIGGAHSVETTLNLIGQSVVICRKCLSSYHGTKAQALRRAKAKPGEMQPRTSEGKFAPLWTALGLTKESAANDEPIASGGEAA